MRRRIYFLALILTLTLSNPNPNPIGLTIQIDLLGQNWLLSLDRVVPHIVLRKEQRIVFLSSCILLNQTKNLVLNQGLAWIHSILNALSSLKL